MDHLSEEKLGAEAVPPGGRPRSMKRVLKQLLTCVHALAFIVLVVALARNMAVPTEQRFQKPERLGYYLTRGDTQVAGWHGEPMKPGDAVQFVYRAQAASYLAIIRVDAGGYVQVLYPDGPTATHAPAGIAGRDVILPQRLTLDDMPGHERIVGLFCQQPIELEPLRRTWQAISGQGDPPAPAGCRADAFSWEKRPW
jgi:hypothetical protein